MKAITTPEEAFADLKQRFPDKIVCATKSVDNFAKKGGSNWQLSAFPTEHKCVSARGGTYEEALAKLTKEFNFYDPVERLKEEAKGLGLKLVPTDQ